MNLQTYQQLWKKGLLTSKSVTDDLAVGPERFEIYKGFVHSHYQDSLIRMFPRLCEFMDVPWETWTKEYFEKYPPLAYELNKLTYHFEEFITLKVESDQTLAKFISELIKYELVEFKIFKSDKECLNFHPKLHRLNRNMDVLHFRYDIASWVYECESNNQLLRGEPAEVENYLCIARNPNTDLCVFTKLGPLDLVIIKELIESDLEEKQIIKSLFIQFKDIENISAELFLKQIEFLKKQSIIL